MIFFHLVTTYGFCLLVKKLEGITLELGKKNLKKILLTFIALMILTL